MASELVPLPGDPVALKTRANALMSAAEQIQRAINDLRRLADRDDTVSEAIDKVRSKASDVADNITKAHVRYLGTAQALQEYAPKLEAGQQRAQRAIAAHTSAQQQVATAQASLQHQSEQYTHDQANQPASSSSATPPQPFGTTAAGTRASQAVSDANDAVGNALGEYNAAIAEIDAAAQIAISMIDSAMDDSGLNDGFWDKVGHVLSELKDLAQKYLAPFLDVLQKIAAAVADIGGYLSMILNILAVFIPVLAPIAAAVDIIVLAAAAISFLATAALVVLGDRTLGDLLNTGITLVASALPIKNDAALLKGARGLGAFSRAADKLTVASEDAGKLSKLSAAVFDKADHAQDALDHLAEKVGRGGEALGSKFASRFTGSAEQAAKGSKGLKAFTGSLYHGTGFAQAASNATRQMAHVSGEDFSKLTGNAVTHVTSAAFATGIGAVNNNVSALTDQAVMPHAGYFQYRSGVDIQGVAPNIQIASSPTHEFHTTAGGFNPANDVTAVKNLFTDAPKEVARAFTGTAVLGDG
ncbi:MAG: hypothetical protein FWF16_03900 [Microbacteriaceae bacterium]|nr:hypothetical protein [Microbacteriaceae bacterium]